jgi:hypothetical protein
MTKKGRPTEYEEAASRVVTLRFTPTQYNHIEKLANTMGGTIPMYLRWMFNEMAENEASIVFEDGKAKLPPIAQTVTQVTWPQEADDETTP